MKKLEKSGLTLNRQKCQTGLTSIESLENTLSEHVLQESSDKGKAIFHRGISQNYETSLAIITSPLWDLTKARTKWRLSFHGDQNGEKGFLGIKTRVTHAGTCYGVL